MQRDRHTTNNEQKEQHMNTTIASQPQLAHLPEDLRLAQQAITLPEVQDMMRKLATYNLGICMPHIHTPSESFAVLPVGTVQVERGLEVSFAAKSETPEADTIPVAWRWEDGGPSRVADCAGATACSWCHCSG